MSTSHVGTWFAIQTKARHEQAVTRQLEQKGYECFLPTYHARRRWSDRVKHLMMPLFAGYMFCRFDQRRLVRVVTTPGLIRIVGFAGKPIPVEDDEIVTLQRIAAASVHVEPVEFLRVGQRVRIESGSLSGIEGVLLSMRGRQRVVVSVSLLQRSVAVELSHDVLSPVEDERVSPPAMDLDLTTRTRFQ